MLKVDGPITVSNSDGLEGKLSSRTKEGNSNGNQEEERKCIDSNQIEREKEGNTMTNQASEVDDSPDAITRRLHPTYTSSKGKSSLGRELFFFFFLFFLSFFH